MLATVERMTAQRHASEEAWRSAIREACKSHTIREVAAVAGVSRARVHQIVHGR
jgi:hypothetical protein